MRHARLQREGLPEQRAQLRVGDLWGLQGELVGVLAWVGGRELKAP